jgi:HK97 family phage major capsid protein
MWTPIKMQARINTAIVRGNGVGKPHGILSAASLITVSKETSQDAATIIMPNIENMWNRLYAPLRSNAIWLINQECEPMLNGMAFVPSAVAPGAALNAMTAWGPVYLPGGNIADSPYGRMKGRPVIPMNPCSALGTIGDIILTDLSQYMALRKAAAAGIRVDTSIHLHFDQAIDTYRFIFRVTGQPMWNSTISPENGSNTYSWAVALETRS